MTETQRTDIERIKNILIDDCGDHAIHLCLLVINEIKKKAREEGIKEGYEKGLVDGKSKNNDYSVGFLSGHQMGYAKGFQEKGD